MAALAANTEPGVAATIDGLYRAFADLEVAARTGELLEFAALAADAQSVIDRIRLHRLPLSAFVLGLLQEVVSCFTESSDDSAVARARQAVAGIVLASQPPESDRTDLELFADEAREQLERCRQTLAGLGAHGELDASQINGAFRALHTFKGNCGLMGLAKLEGLARVAEDALGGLRSGELAPTNDLRTALLGLLTTTERALNEPTESGDAARQELLVAAQQARLRAKETRLGDLLVARKLVDPLQVQAALAWQQRPLGEVLVELDALSSQALDETLREQRRLRGGPALPVSQGSAAATFKAGTLVQVQDERLRHLVELATKLATRAEALAATVPDQPGAAEVEELISSLREALGRVRLLPVTRALKRAQLVVNDLARKQGKLIELVIDGQELEVSRSALEHLSTIFLHVAKNAIDHGLETPAEREKVGKPPTGQLRVAFSSERGHLELVISDDGRGLDRERILERATELGIRLPDASESEVAELIFRPGFSTSPAISDASGRGVGMDAVRAAVQLLHGSVRVASRPGQGTSLTITLPCEELDLTPRDSQSSGTWSTAPQRQAR